MNYSDLNMMIRWKYNSLDNDHQGGILIHIIHSFIWLSLVVWVTSVLHPYQKAVTMPTLSPLVAPEVVIMTTSGATNDDKDGIVTTLDFHW